jgi:hypothetical protein
MLTFYLRCSRGQSFFAPSFLSVAHSVPIISLFACPPPHLIPSLSPRPSRLICSPRNVVAEKQLLKSISQELSVFFTQVRYVRTLRRSTVYSISRTCCVPLSYSYRVLEHSYCVTLSVLLLLHTTRANSFPSPAERLAL